MEIGFPKESGIYCFENILDGKKYIGQAENINVRIKRHKQLLRDECDQCLALQRAWTKYTIDNFKIYVIELCSIENLNDREKYWIKKLKSHISEGGYNICYGGEQFMHGRKHTEESKKKMSEKSKGRKKSEETKKRMSERQIGEKNHRFGMKNTKEMRQKISEAVSGEKNGFYGKEHTEESKKKMSDANTGRKYPGASSKYIGVVFSKQMNKWVCNFDRMGVHYYLGYFENEIDAAIAYNEKMIEVFGENAKLNIIEEEGNE